MKKILIGSIFLNVCFCVTIAQTKPANQKSGITYTQDNKKNIQVRGGVDFKQLTNGKKVYDLYCQACHQADGNGVPRLNPPLSGTVYVNGSKSRLIDIVLKGLNTPLEINGEEYENPMAAHDFLTDQQIADVLTYVRNSFGNKAGSVSIAEVKKQRAKK